MPSFFRSQPTGRLTGYSLIKHLRGEQSATLAQAAFFEQEPPSGVSAEAAWTEQADSAALSGAIRVTGSAALIEQADTCSISATLRVGGSAALVEQADSVAISGSVGTGISAAIVFSEQADTCAALATVRVNASAGWAEQADLAGFSALVLVRAGLVWIEDADAVNGAGSISAPPVAAIAWIEQADITEISAFSDGPEYTSAPAISAGTRAGGTKRPISQNETRSAQVAIIRPAATQGTTRYEHQPKKSSGRACRPAR